MRQDSSFRNWITADGSPGPTGIVPAGPDHVARLLASVA